MGKLAFIFPGQGSQAVGMGRDYYEQDERFVEYLKQIDEWVQDDLSSYMLNGPMEKLTLTYYAQPALLGMSYWLFKELAKEGISPQYSAGHSLGEYSALVACGNMTIKEGIQAVHQRGRLMNEAVPVGQGAMSAILGADRETLEEIVEEISSQDDVVGLANINSPKQIVISGTKTGVEKAGLLAKERGAKRVIPLNVSGPFHSKLMEPAAKEFTNVLKEISFKNGNFHVISNVTARDMMQEEINERLIQQLVSPVRWVECIEYMIEQGVDTFVEVGPNKVLSGLMKSINPKVTVYSVYDKESLQEFVKAYKGEN